MKLIVKFYQPDPLYNSEDIQLWLGRTGKLWTTLWVPKLLVRIYFKIAKRNTIGQG